MVQSGVTATAIIAEEKQAVKLSRGIKCTVKLVYEKHCSFPRLTQGCGCVHNSHFALTWFQSISSHDIPTD